MVKARVLFYHKEGNYHTCEIIPGGDVGHYDLLIDGKIKVDNPEELVGKIVEWDYDFPYISIASTVTLVKSPADE